MDHPIARAIERKRQAEDKPGKIHPLMDLPKEGKILEPVIGRMRCVSTEIPTTINVDELRRKGRDLPDPTRKNLRSRAIDVWETQPQPEPLCSNTLRIIQENQPMIRIGLRADLPKELADRYRQEPYVTRMGQVGVDEYTRQPFYKWHQEFYAGQVLNIPSTQAVALLRHANHGQWLEEKGEEPPPPPPKKRGRPRKRTTEPTTETTTRSEA